MLPDRSAEFVHRLESPADADRRRACRAKPSRLPDALRIAVDKWAAPNNMSRSEAFRAFIERSKFGSE